MSNKTAKRLFDGLLTEAGVEQEKFYRLFHALEEAPYIKRDSIRVTHNQPYAAITLMAEYKGDEQIGHARRGSRDVNPEAFEAATRVYEDISRMSGIMFTQVLPFLDDGECIGYANIGLDKETSMPLVLKK